jgi:O-antigen/teichoic acid export membrane protein
MGRALLARNLAANYAYFAVTALVALFIVPVYAQQLGPLAWGQLAVCLTVLGFLLFLDLALAPVLVRDVAAAVASGGARQVYRHYLRAYGSFAAACFILGQVLVSLLEAGIAGLPPLAGGFAWALRLMLVQFAFQLANAVVVGYWNGLQQQLRANLRLAAFTLLKHAGALACVLFWSPSALAYMVPFALLSMLEFALNARTLAHDGAAPAPGPEAPRVAGWQGIAAFGLAAALGLLTVQIDRLYLAQALDTEAFGRYYLLGYLAMAALNFHQPIQRVFLPRLAAARQQRSELVAMARVTLALIGLPCLLVALFPESVLRIWLHDETIARTGAETLRLLFLAVAVTALAAGPKLLLVHLNQSRLLVAVNATILVAQGLVLWLFADAFGMLAGGLAWLASAAIQAAVGALQWRRAVKRPVPDRRQGTAP